MSIRHLAVSVLFPLALVVAQTPQPVFTNLNPSGQSPAARYGHAMCAYQSGVLLFGGHNGSSFLNDTWYYNAVTNAWTQLFPSVSPSPRRWAAMDARFTEPFLFGGNVTSGVSNQLWRFDGSNWILQPISGAAPSARSAHAMAWDPGRNALIVYGGQGLGDTWAYGSSWSQISSTTAPGALAYASLAYDRGNARMMLVGGVRQNGTYENRCWTLGASTNNWSLRPETVNATGIMGASMCFDTFRRRMVLFAGQTAPQTQSALVYEHDGTNWFLRTGPGSILPNVRYGHRSVYLRNLQSSVLSFGGGYGSGNVLGDLNTYRISPTASYSVSGLGCASPVFGPVLGQFGAPDDQAPWLGQSITRQAFVAGSPACVLAMGMQPAQLSLQSAGMTGCTLHTSADVLLLLGNVNFFAIHTLQVPNNPALQGVQFHEQIAALVLGANPAGVLLSNAMRGVVSGK